MAPDTADFNPGQSSDTGSNLLLSKRDTFFEQALSLHQQGDVEQALTLYQQVVDLDPDHAQACFYSALLLCDSGNHEDALSLLEKAQALLPDIPAIVYQLGVCQYTLGENNLAIRSFETVLETEQDHWQAAYNLGAAYFSDGQILKAIEAYSLAARLNPDDADIYFNLGLAHKNAGDLEKARSAYIHSMEIIPDDADVHYNLGRLHNDMGQKEDAITSLEIATVLRPDFGAALTNLGVLYVDQNATDKAIAVYEKLIEIDHHPISSRHILNALTGKTTDSAPLSYVRELYDDFAGHFDKRLVEDLLYDIPRQFVDFLNEQRATQYPFQRMLDLGCGTGLCGQAFSGMVNSITGVDLSEKMIEKARSKDVYDALIQDDIISFVEGVNEPYDLIVAGDVLIYLGELESIFNRLANCLSENGRVLFSTECFDGKGYRLCQSGRYAHSTSYVTKLAQENGLQVLAVKSVNSRKEHGAWIAGDIYLLGHVL
nr:tetratricopeptide repeat protein [Desulfobulbaceae bacterium]